MRRHRVRVDALVAGERRLMGPAAHHLLRVLRVRPGAPIAAFDGLGHEALGEVVAVADEVVVVRLEAPAPAAREPDRAIVLAPALLKGDKLADVVRMGTELGVATFRPVRTRRCDATDVSPARLARWRRVADEAARQCGRARVPEVADAVPLDALEWEGALWVADPRAETAWADALAELGDGPVTVVTGPEGGLTEGEVAALVARGARAVVLGRRVLRAETAPVAAAAALALAEGG